jgi:hypothetical protein
MTLTKNKIPSREPMDKLLEGFSANTKELEA